MNVSLLLILISIASIAASPGLLRLPKVYNALITSNQNLSPSRAFPVIQPIVHKTAIGYVPPFYYMQVSHNIAGPEILRVPHLSMLLRTENVLTKKKNQKPKNESELSITANILKRNNTKSNVPQKNDVQPKDTITTNAGQVPLNFYPNDHSLYYDPYFYTHNMFNSHLPPPVTFYLDYHTYGTLPSLPTLNTYNEYLLQNTIDNKISSQKKEETKNIWDISTTSMH
ncbi:uncharacterized protein LOC107266847 [Cephus cinctus]|uniref:Uncharacterized protein LOC107266847 n=1 Tax=Cephus cinctus TaxID=211228 RepID=A0AAJ7BT27_CEPCN|nr:uncharacterized protein LOC107266847 [Cephus cinctus]